MNVPILHPYVFDDKAQESCIGSSKHFLFCDFVLPAYDQNVLAASSLENNIYIYAIYCLFIISFWENQREVYNCHCIMN